MLESSNHYFKEANNELSKTNQLMFKDLKKFQAELDKYNDVNYASKVEIDCAKAKGDLMSYKINFEKSSNAYTQKINDLNQTISYMKKELCAHQETIFIMSQAKEAQIKLYKTREDKELDKVIALENKVKFLKKAQRANPRLYDIAWLWHRRLSHLNFDTINLLSKNNIVNGLPKLKFVKDHLCSSCELGKAKRKSFHTKTTPSSKRRLQLLHMDLCGPMRVESINGKKYVLVIVDDYSRYTWTHFLRSKDETPGVLIDFLTLVQRGLHAQVTTVRTDKGTEFLNKTLHAYFAKEGIRHETSTARTPEQNGVVERRNRTLVEAARTMLSAAKVPLFFWIFTIAETVTTSNELELLYSPMFSELLNGTSHVVSKSSAVHAADNPDKRQQHNTTHTSTTTNVADPPPLNIHSTHQTPTQVPTVTAPENIIQAETNTENAQFDEDEFI
ncbi:retrovirus-related pol polyprotein from transposon TNT 1-94 [Tanacetum coccineum]